VDNVSNGFDIYKMQCGTFVKTLVTKEAQKTHPKGVAFADKSRLVVGGSDHGLVYIFERKTGRVVKTLKHARKGGVETIGVRIFLASKKSQQQWMQVQDLDDGAVLIATASATVSSGNSVIQMWRWKTKQNTGREELVGGGWTFWEIMEFVLKLVVVMAAMSYSMDLVKHTVCEIHFGP
jgi:hypothetical protein